ncbi:unnamed protein product [Fusarium venenatum]|uniref:Uncharacterized protein n=1 Tax=Fusarium venenatum TaxID=56646 RepID=A0A2L2T5C3_9HYPO|nr:uncharacterized protein FVRRES_04637 [Fusarium venenatum]CEI60201.1 unnamed protein product [Fusarium venenatum]
MISFLTVARYAAPLLASVLIGRIARDDPAYRWEMGLCVASGAICAYVYLRVDMVFRGPPDSHV